MFVFTLMKLLVKLLLLVLGMWLDLVNLLYELCWNRWDMSSSDDSCPFYPSFISETGTIRRYTLRECASFSLSS